MAKIITKDDVEEVIYLSGGMLEVQPKGIIVLADVALRASEIDEQQALVAKQRAEEKINKPSNDVDFAEIAAELARALAQLRVVQFSKRKHNP